jgi:hypothetical protein
MQISGIEGKVEERGESKGDGGEVYGVIDCIYILGLFFFTPSSCLLFA